jgi:hypothetical protein
MGATSRTVFGDTSPENSLMHSAPVIRKPDFSGWATRANLKCTDGRTILRDAFAHQDSAQVPLVWQHGHNEPGNVLGHTLLEQKDGSTYCYGYFNETPTGANAKALVDHKDITALSIFANQLVERSKQVSHGVIREVSLVMAGANPGALIDNIELQHADGESVTLSDEAIIYTGEALQHGEDPAKDKDKDNVDNQTTMQAVYDEMSEPQKEVLHYMVGEALEGSATSPDSQQGNSATHTESNEEGTQTMATRRNVFEQNGSKGSTQVVKHQQQSPTLTRDDQRGIFADAMRVGSLREAAEAYALKHGIENIDVLFPEVRPVDATPQFDTRRIEWVKEVLASIAVLPHQDDERRHHSRVGQGARLHQGEPEEGGVLRASEAGDYADHGLQEAEA